VLKKTSANTGLVIATAAGALLTGSPAFAQPELVTGGHHHFSHRFSHHSHHRNRNWNGNHTRPRIFIRIYIYNKNNNRTQALVAPQRDSGRPVRGAQSPSVFDDDFDPLATAIGLTPPAGTPADKTPAAGSHVTRPAADTPVTTPDASSTGAPAGAPATAPKTASKTAAGKDPAGVGAGSARTGRGNDEGVDDVTPAA
jgi:hypothetical protein